MIYTEFVSHFHSFSSDALRLMLLLAFSSIFLDPYAICVCVVFQCYFLLRHNWLCRVHTNAHGSGCGNTVYLVLIYVCDNLWLKPFSDISFCIVNNAQYLLVCMLELELELEL